MQLKNYSMLLIICLVALKQVAAEELIMTAPPRESKEAGIKQYTPTAEFASKILGKPVKYVHPGNWLTYQHEMRNGSYDIVFDGPHFAAWRMAHLGHIPLVKLPGHLQFYLLTAAGDDMLNSPDELIGKAICGISPPNLSTLSVLAYYQNPVRQPVIKGIKGGMGKVYKAYQQGECRAFVLRSTFYHKKLTDDQRKSLKILYKTPKLPNQVFTASKKISGEEQNKLRAAFVTEEGQAATAPTLKRFAGKTKSFVFGTVEEYQGHNSLLEGVIFGW